jgi:tetratricopeptide (TPR) repeat protein
MRITFVSLLLLTLVFTACKEENDPKAELYFKEGTKLLELNETESALLKFRSALDYKSNESLQATIYRNISIAFQNLEQLDSASYYSQKGYEVAPSDSYIFYINRAEYNLLNNNVFHSIKDLKVAKSLDPKQMEVYHTLCLIYSGEYGDAYFDPTLSEYYAKKSFKLKPSNTSKEQLGSIYFQNEKYKEAVKIFKELYAKDPTNKKFEFYLGQCLYFAGEEKEGEAHMQSAAERDESCKLMYHEIFEIGQNLD